eukprot:2561360-Alexandrium_andersonii.AAC.1
MSSGCAKVSRPLSTGYLRLISFPSLERSLRLWAGTSKRRHASNNTASISALAPTVAETVR